MKPFLICLLLSGLSLTAYTPGWAQAGIDADRRYKAALKLVQLGEYERAKADLNALAQRDDSRAAYASYYLAVVAFRQKDYTKARLVLKELTDRFPDWRKLDDVHYLFACAAMETGQYEDALARLPRIGDPELKDDVDKLERHFLARVTDLGRLKAMQREFSNNRNVALALVDLIQRSSTVASDLDLADKLAVRFGVQTAVAVPTRPAAVTVQNGTAPPATSGKAPAAASTSGRSRNKSYYNVAVMFPFRIGEFDVGQRGRPNQYVYDMYEGIKLAREKLQEEGITINLLAYDIDNDANKTLDVLNAPSFRQTDLIIGPLYAEPNRLVTAYAGPGAIPVVNPIATSIDLIANQPMAFLAQPSLVQQAEKVAAFTRNVSAVRRVAVYFGASRKDSLLAAAYQTALKKQGIQLIEYRRLATTTDAIVAGITLSETAKPGCVFLASSNEEDGPRLLEALTRRNISCAVVATAAAFDEYRNSLSTFTRRELYLLYPDFIDTDRAEVTDFEETYLVKRNIIPSVYASQGYDIMLFFGRLLAKNTLQERSRINFKSDTTDYVLSGFDYTQSNDNQVVPIVKIEDGKFVKANQ